MDEKNARPEDEVPTPRWGESNLEKTNVDTPPKSNEPSFHAKLYEYPIQQVHMPHMNPSSIAPPNLDEFNYSYWKSWMRSHLRCVCVELWGIVENGFMAVDEKCMTPKEQIECQLKSTALDKTAKA
jgi:hypothetical protein